MGIDKIRTVQGKSVRCCDFWPVSIFKRLKCIFWRLLHRPFKFSLGPTFFMVCRNISSGGAAASLKLLKPGKIENQNFVLHQIKSIPGDLTSYEVSTHAQ